MQGDSPQLQRQISDLSLARAGGRLTAARRGCLQGENSCSTMEKYIPVVLQAGYTHTPRTCVHFAWQEVQTLSCGRLTVALTALVSNSGLQSNFICPARIYRITTLWHYKAHVALILQIPEGSAGILANQDRMLSRLKGIISTHRKMLLLKFAQGGCKFCSHW